MTDIATTQLTTDEARELTAEIRRDLDGLLPKIKRAFEGRADKALGYDSWQAYCSAELSDVRVPVGSRPAMVAELRQSGMSQRAIGAALGVHHSTVAEDLKSTGGNPPVEPERVVSLDGRQRPAVQPKPEIPAADLAEFPELEHFADRPAKAAALATQLRGFEPAEQAARRETLGKVIQAEKEGRLAVQPDPGDEAVAQADRLFIAVNEAAQVAEKVGDVAAIEEAVRHADPDHIELWRTQFTDLAATLVRLAGACRPKLRSVQ
ncbi:hypothetical protein ACFQS1_14895 [Paractinoplanes rhizophilus]|uniref:Homeodomain-like domain-containing protein n=1 Tax=Paractinoplanes rhizophilus TaxID=1416877 RepID=A0ABW2HU42_9ACTN